MTQAIKSVSTKIDPATIHQPSNETSYDSSSSRNKKKVLLSAIIGNGLEFYDFALFGAFSVTFSQIFFTGDRVVSLISTLSIFALAFFVRPVGSIFFGYVGDRFGRKKALSSSIVCMGLFTFLIGCLPTHNEIGALAPVLLLLCRVGQGFSLGGENNGSAIFLLEHLKRRKGFAGALILTGGAIGTVLATLLAGVVNLSFMPHWAWRIPFLLGILIGFLGIYIRRSIEETPEFLSSKKQKKELAPLIYVLKNYARPFLCVIGIGGVNGVLGYTLVVYINVYLTTVVHYPLTNSLFFTCIALVIFGCLSPVMGHLADKIGERKIMASACVMAFIFPALILYLLQQHSPLAISLATILAAIMMSSFNSPTNSLVQRLFPAKVRYTGIALGYAIGIAIIGGTQPLVSTYLIKATQNPYSPIIYHMFAGVIGCLALYFSKDITGASTGFSQITPEYSRPSKAKSSGIPSREKEVASRVRKPNLAAKRASS